MVKTARRLCNRTAYAASLLPGGTAIVGNAKHFDDPHYTPSGFFNIHICNWPDRPPFYLTLYSTTRFNDVRSERLYAPDGYSIGALALDEYPVIERANPKNACL